MPLTRCMLLLLLDELLLLLEPLPKVVPLSEPLTCREKRLTKSSPRLVMFVSPWKTNVEFWRYWYESSVKLPPVLARKLSIVVCIDAQGIKPVLKAKFAAKLRYALG